jgi:hypothetical protein
LDGSDERDFEVEVNNMAGTGAYTEAEAWIRTNSLQAKFGQQFEKRFLKVGVRSDGTDATHEFDAVSADGTIVTSIKAHSGKTSGNRNPVGKINSTFTEVLFLGLVKEAKKKYLVLTDPEFHSIFRNKSDGKLPEGVELLHLPLPPEIQARVNEDKKKASLEMTGE